MFDLSAYLEARRRLIDEVLDRGMPSADTRPALLHEAMRYSVFTGGKRLRPILCLASAEAAGGTVECAMPPAIALELLHTYTLIHDDLPCMDDDDMRRGKATSHRVYGDANAILAGDALQALAFQTVAQTGSSRLVLELARAAGSCGVVGGQVEDIAMTGATPDAATVDFVHQHKTADLFRAATRMGGIAAEADEQTVQALTEYGNDLGMAFQIADDLLDAPSQTADTGNDELSYLLLHTPEQARERANALLQSANEALKGLDRGPVAPLSAIARFVLARDH